MAADVYRDTSARYAHDAEFRVLVDLLLHAAIEHGYTPGELKQAVFMAALKAEEYAFCVNQRHFDMDYLRKMAAAEQKGKE